MLNQEVQYGPDVGTEADFRLCGDVKGKRVLELGWAQGGSSIAFAKQGAIAIAVDSSPQQLAIARRLCEREGVRVELHQGDLAELAFIRADTVDLVFSAYSLGFVADLNRVFRQVHRVLKPGAPLVFSLPHPSSHLVEPDDESERPIIRRSYFDRSPIEHERDGVTYVEQHRTISELFTGLSRANFRVDTVLEPEPPARPPSQHWREAFRYLPRTLIVRARKEGI